MALLNLGKKKAAPKKEAAKKPAKAALVATAGAKMGASFAHVLKRPHITEKAAASAEKGVYVFEVSTNSNKRQISDAVRAFYKVTPVKVTIVTIPARRITVKGRPGVRPSRKKAYVFLKEGEKIELV